MPSKDLNDNPLKSLVLGSAIDISRSRNSYILTDLRVTLQPTGQPFLILKFDISFLAKVTTGFCPVISRSSLRALSRLLEFVFASPRPIFMEILTNLGTSIIFE